MKIDTFSEKPKTTRTRSSDHDSGGDFWHQPPLKSKGGRLSNKDDKLIKTSLIRDRNRTKVRLLDKDVLGFATNKKSSFPVPYTSSGLFVAPSLHCLYLHEVIGLVCCSQPRRSPEVRHLYLHEVIGLVCCSQAALLVLLLTVPSDLQLV
jgi:hypothetical protein